MDNKERQPFRALKGKIVEEGTTIKELAAVLEISPSSLSSKLNHRSHFYFGEILKLQAALNIEPHEMNKYFYSVYGI